MKQFNEVMSALQAGQSVRRSAWDSTTVMFVKDGELLQQATGEPYNYDLSWYEIVAEDWTLIEPTTIHPQTLEHVAA